MVNQSIGNFNSKELTDDEVELSKLVEIQNNELQSELSSARKEAEEFSSKIDSETLKKSKLTVLLIDSHRKTEDEHRSALDESSQLHYLKVLKELDDCKQQRNSLYLDIVSANKAKLEAENDFKPRKSYIEELRKTINEAKIEQETIDSRILNVYAEIGEIEARREYEATQFTERISSTKAKIDELRREISRAKDLKSKLAVTASDLNALQNEMEIIKTIDKSFMKANSVERGQNGKEEPGTKLLLYSTKSELEEAKKQLSILRGERFRLMNDIDVLRQGLSQTAEEKANSRKNRKVSDSSLSELNLKLHIATSNLNSAIYDESRAQSIVLNLCSALEQLKGDADEAKLDAELAVEETKAVDRQTRQFVSQAAAMQERLDAAMEELKAAKCSESKALEKLKTVTETAMTERTAAALFGTDVTISKFEYLYLSRHGKAAEHVADLKVSAAEKWREALKAEATAKNSRLQMARKGANEHKRESETASFSDVKKKKNHLLSRYAQDEEFVESLDLKLAIAIPRRSIAANDSAGESMRIKTRRACISSSSSPSTMSGSHRKSLRNLVDFFGAGRRCRKQFCSSVPASSWLY